MNNTSILKMPDGFLWGVATAAHQNEGGNRNNQWAAWEEQPGRIHNGAKAGRATDWWNLETAAADFDRAAELGINSLRLSVEWSRIEPEQGLFDQTALRKYAEMIGLLRARGIEPMVTLHHFTDPLWLTEIGRVGESQGRGSLRPLHGARRRGAGRPGDPLVYGQRADRLCVQRVHGR